MAAHAGASSGVATRIMTTIVARNMPIVAGMSDRLATSIAETVHDARAARGLTVSALAERSGVSRAMIAKIERGDAQPTAVLLGRLSAALGMTLSELVAR